MPLSGGWGLAQGLCFLLKVRGVIVWGYNLPVPIGVANFRAKWAISNQGLVTVTFAYLRGGRRPPLANLGQEENDIAYLRWRRAEPPLANLRQEEDGIAYLGVSPRAPAFEKTL